MNASIKEHRARLSSICNLQGARGILVNITAGPDMSLGEFSDVGEIIEEIASDNATVVVGTAIDPEIGDELRVTVVATGLGQEDMRKPAQGSDRSRPTRPEPDYRDMERPAITRRNPVSVEGSTARKVEQQTERDSDLDYLDIPAFLRRQAD